MLDLPRIELLVLLFLPLAAAIAAALLGPHRRSQIRWVCLGASIGCLALSLALAGQLMGVQQSRGASGDTGGPLPTFRPEFVPGSPGPIRDASGTVRTTDDHATSWDLVRMGSGGIQFYLGLDGLNIWLVVLTTVLMMPAVLISWDQIGERPNEFYAWLMALQTAMLGIFLSFDIILFYVFFELSLVPLFFLIGIWGGPERRYAAGKFFIYTLTGSLITLLGVLGVVLAAFARSGELTFSIPRLVEIVHSRLAIQSPEESAYWWSIQTWVFLALMAGFAVKVPLVPLHTWLPLAHVEAPTAGSVDLAGVLLKAGAYGFLRLCVPLAPDFSVAWGLPIISVLAVIGIVYGAFCAYAQDDVKRMVAYSSVSHLGLVMLGMFALNVSGLSGSLLQMVNHGLSTGGLFLVIGMLYDRYHTRKISDYGGMAARLPVLGACMVFLVLTSVGMPGLNGFVGEVLVLMGAFAQQYDRGQWPIYAVLGTTGVVLGAWYLFTMLQRVFFGPLKEPAPADDPDGHGPVKDMNAREWAIVVPIALLCLAIGVYPQPFIETIRPDVDTIAGIAEGARRRAAELALHPAPATARPEAVAENDREGEKP